MSNTSDLLFKVKRTARNSGGLSTALFVLLVLYAYTGIAWMFNIYAFVTFILTLLILFGAGLGAWYLWYVYVNTPQKYLDSTSVYLFYKELHLTHVHTKFITNYCRAIQVISIFTLVVLGHFVIASLIMLSMSIGLVLSTMAKGFEEDLEMESKLREKDNVKKSV